MADPRSDTGPASHGNKDDVPEERTVGSDGGEDVADSDPEIEQRIPLPASKLPVSLFRQTLLWPLVLDAEPDEGWFEAQCRKLNRSDHWDVCEDPIDLIPDDEIPGAGPAGRYEEAVYFHDFVRDFLYRRDADAPMRVFRRSTPSVLIAKIDGVERRFQVEHCALHLFELGVAILSLDLRFMNDEHGFSLASAQTIVDRLRRAYAPFWFGEGQPGYCPTEVWLDGVPKGLGSLGKRADALAALRQSGAGSSRLREPLFPWWTELLAPLEVEGGAVRSGRGGPRFRQVLDERIPVMTTLSLTPVTLSGESRPVEPARMLELVSEGDWYRIAAADGADEFDYAYNPHFQRGFYKNLFYDRFMASSGTRRDGATRFLFMGYHFAAVGSGWFFENLVAGHMRRHYRQMNLIALLEFSALLMLSSRVSRAATLKGGARRRAIIDVEADFLVFTHRYRFTGVSNQLQAREMFDQLRTSMGLDRLYTEVKEEIGTAAQFALATEQHEQSETVLALTEIATLGLVLSVIVGAFGMNIIVSDDAWSIHGEVGVVGVTLAALAGATSLLVYRRPPLRRLRRPLYLLAALGLIMAAWGWVRESQKPAPPIAQTQAEVPMPATAQ